MLNMSLAGLTSSSSSPFPRPVSTLPLALSISTNAWMAWSTLILRLMPRSFPLREPSSMRPIIRSYLSVTTALPGSLKVSMSELPAMIDEDIGTWKLPSLAVDASTSSFRLFIGPLIFSLPDADMLP